MFRILSIFISIISLMLVGCKTKPATQSFSCNLEGVETVLSENCQPKMDCSFTFKNNGSIKKEYYEKTVTSASVGSGNQLVFAMYRTYQDNPAIADDEFSEKLFFSIPNGQTSFHLEGESDLVKSEMVFATLAYSRDGGYYPVLEGCIEGKLKENGQWNIQGQLIITTRTNRRIVKGIRANYKKG